MNNITVKAPATSANLGPGFDTLGLALDLWNVSTFEPADDSTVYVEGEGKGRVSQGRNNLIIRAAQRLAEHVGTELSPFTVRCTNHIPIGSGLGSSAAATLTGLLAANALTGSALSQEDILYLASEIEGHPDNIAPALLGGLIVSTQGEGKVIVRNLPIAPLYITVVVPDFRFPTTPGPSSRGRFGRTGTCSKADGGSTTAVELMPERSRATMVPTSTTAVLPATA